MLLVVLIKMSEMIYLFVAIFSVVVVVFFFISDVVRIVVFISLKKQPMEVYVDDETKLTLHGLQQYYVKLKDQEKNRKLFDLLDVLEFNQVLILSPTF